MRGVGIVAEYNPFHRGHAYQLEEIRRRDETSAPVVVLSGDFVQRGEAACFDKFARAEAAVRCGAALVLELPLPWCLSSAEGFARGAVGILKAAGVVEEICFGSESGDLPAMERCGEVFRSEAFSARLRDELAGGTPFAAARERAVAALAGQETAAVLRRPNDLLGVEYLKAARDLSFSGPVFPVLRKGPDHDGPGSASDLRRKMERGEEWLSAVPPEAAGVFRREMERGRGPVLPGDLRLPFVSRLRERTPADLAALPDGGEGLENRLYRAIRTGGSPEEIAAAAKSRRYALSRIRRMLMCSALGVMEGMAAGTPPCLRVLAMDERGVALLRIMRKRAERPVIVKPASVRAAGEQARAVLELGSRAHDLYVLGRAASGEISCGEDLRTTPYLHFDREDMTCL